MTNIDKRFWSDDFRMRWMRHKAYLVNHLWINNKTLLTNHVKTTRLDWQPIKILLTRYLFNFYTIADQIWQISVLLSKRNFWLRCIKHKSFSDWLKLYSNRFCGWAWVSHVESDLHLKTWRFVNEMQCLTILNCYRLGI